VGIGYINKGLVGVAKLLKLVFTLRQRKVVLTAKLRLLTNDFTDSATGDGIEATEYHGAKLFRKPFSQRQPLRVQKSEHKVNENEEFRLVMMLNFNMVHYVRGRRAVI
jgi:hypothetical protein